MPDGRQVGPWPVTSVKAETWLVRCDESGASTSSSTRMALLERLRHCPDLPVLLLSHGWINDFPVAVTLYQHFLRKFEALRDDNLQFALSPIAVSVIWPNIWLPSDDGQQIAAGPASAWNPTPIERFLAAIRGAMHKLARTFDDPVLPLPASRLIPTPRSAVTALVA